MGEKHNGIGLIYPSDYGYAVRGNVRNNCLTKKLYNYDSDNCRTNDWLNGSEYLWTLTPDYTNVYAFYIAAGWISDAEFVYNAYSVWPTLYLTTSTKIVDGTGDINSPFVLSVQ